MWPTKLSKSLPLPTYLCREECMLCSSTPSQMWKSYPLHFKHDTPPRWHSPWFFHSNRWNPKANTSFSLAFHASSAATSVTVLPTLFCRWVCAFMPFRTARRLFPDCLQSQGHVILLDPHSVLLCIAHIYLYRWGPCLFQMLLHSLWLFPNSRCQLLEGLCSGLQNLALSNTDIEQRRNKASRRTKRVRVRERKWEKRLFISRKCSLSCIILFIKYWYQT